MERENLFDYEGSPRRTEKLKRAIGKDLKGWTPARRDRKIDQLASIIAQMNGGLGPDLLGICEVENEFVVDRLANVVNQMLSGRNYRIVHADTRDQRGIDVAFLYDRRYFVAPPGERFHHVVMRRTATREIFQVNFRTHRGRTWTVFGNHWPSRRGGALESAGYRYIAGETLAYFHQRAREEHGDETPVLVMGDFNDEPFDRSLVQYALGTSQRTKVLKAKSPVLWNLMWGVLGRGEGTFYFNNAANVIDQFLVNAHMAKQNSEIQALEDTVEIVRFPEMISGGAYPAPIPFGAMGKPVNKDGYSDHFPIGVKVRENA